MTTEETEKRAGQNLDAPPVPAPGPAPGTDDAQDAAPPEPDPKLESQPDPGADDAPNAAPPELDPKLDPELDTGTDDAPVVAPDLNQRVLCPDGACIGVIGPDGRCKVCSTVLEGFTASDAADATDSLSPADSGDETDDFDPEPDEADDDGELDLSTRELCPDGECIGVLGPDGNCKACGKPSTWTPDDEPDDAAAAADDDAPAPSVAADAAQDPDRPETPEQRDN